ncbi:MAG: FAD-dependent oxidoreductase [Magnetococcales bacterium]|nr:FAD-dependent oxidoreductase [Magnetococcales bacterium]
MNTKPKILVLGGSFAGLAAAFELKHKLKDRAEITVLSKDPQFVFIPSLIWLVPGWRQPEEIVFDLEPALTRHDIRFVQGIAKKIDAEKNRVLTHNGEMAYDYLVVATGPRMAWEAVPGLGPHGGHTLSACTLPHAIEAAKAWQDFLKNPGPVVVGAVQGASCFGASYEILLNLNRALKVAGVRNRSPLTFITAEPFLTHFGINGFGSAQPIIEKFFQRAGINWLTSNVVEKVTPGEIHTRDNGVLPFNYSILIPPFQGVGAVKESLGIGNAMGFVPVNDRYQHLEVPNIYAAGISVAVSPPAPTPVPCGVPKTAHMSEQMAAVAAHNIAADILGGPPKEVPFPKTAAVCVMDAGNQGVLMVTDRIFAPRKIQLLIPGPWSHWLKIVLEKYLIWKLRTGRMQLP